MELGRSGGVQGDRTDRTKTAQQLFARFGLTWHRKVHFSQFSGKLTFHSTRNGPQNPQFCPGSLQDTFIIYSSISHQHIFRKLFPKQKNLENRKSENLKFQKPRFTNKCPDQARWPSHWGCLFHGVHAKGSWRTSCHSWYCPGGTKRRISKNWLSKNWLSKNWRSMAIPILGYSDPWLFRSMAIPIHHGYSDPCLFRSMSIPIHVYSDPCLFRSMAITDSSFLSQKP